MDERFTDLIKWDDSGRMMVIDDFQLFWAQGMLSPSAHSCLSSPLNRPA